MGVGGASKLIASAEDTPNASGAALFPAAAAANRSIFYNRDGSARSVSQVYGVLTSRYDSAAQSPLTRTAMASAGVAPASRTASSFAPNKCGLPGELFRRPARRRPRGADRRAAGPARRIGAPIFRSCSRAASAPSGVAGGRELWATATSITTAGKIAARKPARRRDIGC